MQQFDLAMHTTQVANRGLNNSVHGNVQKDVHSVIKAIINHQQTHRNARMKIQKLTIPDIIRRFVGKPLNMF